MNQQINKFTFENRLFFSKLLDWVFEQCEIEKRTSFGMETFETEHLLPVTLTPCPSEWKIPFPLEEISPANGKVLSSRMHRPQGSEDPSNKLSMRVHVKNDSSGENCL